MFLLGIPRKELLSPPFLETIARFRVGISITNAYRGLVGKLHEIYGRLNVFGDSEEHGKLEITFLFKRRQLVLSSTGF